MRIVGILRQRYAYNSNHIKHFSRRLPINERFPCFFIALKSSRQMKYQIMHLVWKFAITASTTARENFLPRSFFLSSIAVNALQDKNKKRKGNLTSCKDIDSCMCRSTYEDEYEIKVLACPLLTRNGRKKVKRWRMD